MNATIDETTEDHKATAAVVEALAVVDKALAEMLRRELVASGEVADLLLDLRSILVAGARPVVATSAAS